MSCACPARSAKPFSRGARSAKGRVLGRHRIERPLRFLAGVLPDLLAGRERPNRCTGLNADDVKLSSLQNRHRQLFGLPRADILRARAEHGEGKPRRRGLLDRQLDVFEHRGVQIDPLGVERFMA